MKSLPARLSACLRSASRGALWWALAAGLLTTVPLATAQPRKDSAVLAMTLEPPGLDPTAGAASAIAEITLYNIFETLTKVPSDGQPVPLLAESWTASPDLRVWTFRLRQGVKFHNGEPFDAATVKFAFERAAAAGSANKDRATFANIDGIATPDAHTVVLTLKNGNPDLPFQLGQATAVMVEPKSAAGNATQPVGTGPYRLDSWARGSSMTLLRWDSHRNAKSVALRRVTMRFISDPAAQVAALLSGDVDAFPRVSAARSLGAFGNSARFQVLVAGSRAKTILAMNHKRKPLDDVRVRQAIASAIDRRAVVEGAADGYGVPIGSYYVPGAPGYIDTTAINAYDPARSRALLTRAGVALPLELTLKLPPPPYARQGGEVIAAMLAKVGINAKIENVEWAQWLGGTFKGNFDLSVINHVEPLDYMQYANTGYYWGYDSKAFRDLAAQHAAAGNAKERAKLFGDLQRLIATDAVNAFLFNPTNVSVSRQGLKGLWAGSPIFANDMAAVSWQ